MSREPALTNLTLKIALPCELLLNTDTVAPSRYRDTFASCFSRTPHNLAQLLLDAGAAVNIVDDKGRTPLFAAARYRHAGTVALLLCRQADMNLADLKQRTPLLAAAEHGHINTINLLLEKGANHLAFDSKGRSALHEAAQNGHELCTMLLCRSVNYLCFRYAVILILAAACAPLS
jgi:ankyrin repeat protein